MKYFISVDFEGISGTNSWKQDEISHQKYKSVMKHMACDVNAAAEGIFLEDPQAEILVCDSHAGGENINFDDLDPRLELISGRPRNFFMMQDLDSTFDLAFLIGYHSKAGTLKGLMDHSFTNYVTEIKLNGKSVGETFLNTAFAGYYNVPLGLITGDDKMADEVKEFLDENAQIVITKRAVSRFSARMPHPSKMVLLIKDAASKAVKNVKKIKPLKLQGGFEVEVELNTTDKAEICELIPGSFRKTGRIIAYKDNDFMNIYRFVCCVYHLAALLK